jgi:hypothetical protein
MDGSLRTAGGLQQGLCTAAELSGSAP